MPEEDDDLKLVLNALPDIQGSVSELFTRAMRKNEQRFYCSIVDVCRTIDTRPADPSDTNSEPTSKRYLTTDIYWPLSLRQFSDFLHNVTEVSAANGVNQEVLLRIQMLTYCQFWDSLGIQRLLYSLTEIVSNQDYNPEALCDQDPPQASHNYQRIIKSSGTENLSVGNVIGKLYHNRLRNCFAHADYAILGDLIVFGGILKRRKHRMDNLSVGTFTHLFESTVEFIHALFDARRSAEQTLIRINPFPVSLPEFGSRFNLKRNNMGHWCIDIP